MTSRRGGLVTMRRQEPCWCYRWKHAGHARGLACRRGEFGPRCLYNAHEREHWLSTDESTTFAGVRDHGHRITVNGDLQPVVDLTYIDGLGVPLDRAGVLTPGAISDPFDPRVVGLKRSPVHVLYLQERDELDHDMTATQAAADWGHVPGHRHRSLGLHLQDEAAGRLRRHGDDDARDLCHPRHDEVLGKVYYANVEQDFVPDGSPVRREVGRDLQRGVQHVSRPASAHGGSRQDVKLCVLCHHPQTTDPDTGDTVDFKVMVARSTWGRACRASRLVRLTDHRINNSVNDFSTVVFPPGHPQLRDVPRGADVADAVGQLVRLPEPRGLSVLPRRRRLRDRAEPSGRHPGRRQPLLDLPPPQGGGVDASVIGAHTVPFKSTQLKGINATIVSVTNTAPGQNPTISFTLAQNDGTPISPASFGSNLNVLMSGPTTDYAINPFREGAKAAAFEGTTAHRTRSPTRSRPTPRARGLFPRGAPDDHAQSGAERHTDGERVGVQSGVLRRSDGCARRRRAARSWSLPTATRATTRSCCTGACAGTPRCASCATTPTRTIRPSARPSRLPRSRSTSNA